MGKPTLRILSFILPLLLSFSSCIEKRGEKETIATTPTYPHYERKEKETSQSNLLLKISTGKISEGIQNYLEANKKNHHNLSTIQEIALAILENNHSFNYDSESALQHIFGIGISRHPRLLPLMEKGLHHRNPQVQLASINFLSSWYDDRADLLIEKGMLSRYLIVQLETAYHLAMKQQSIGKIEALFEKVEDDLRPFFPQLFAMMRTTAATEQLTHLLHDHDLNVRLETILTIIQHERDDFLPEIQTLATHLEIAQQEACAAALGTFKDRNARPILTKQQTSAEATLRLASWRALAQLGDQEARAKILEEAKKENYFAIPLLEEGEEAKTLLLQLLHSKDINVRIAATLALLKQKDQHCLPGLLDILIKDPRDLAFLRQYSPGKTLSYWKVIPSSQENIKNARYTRELSLKMQEESLRKALDLPEESFLTLAKTIFHSRQTALIPTLVSLLETLQSDEAIALLKEQQQKVGAPLTRDYCNLALFRLNEEGPYLEKLHNWLDNYQKNTELQFRALVPHAIHAEPSAFQLTAEERSRLLIETFAALAESREEKNITLLLNTLAKAHPKNRYALAGLLLNATE